MIDRYARQRIFRGIGDAGQKKLGEGYAVIIGCGALGSAIASCLVRAGVGRVRVVDRDFIEYHNLPRQLLFDEDDIEEQLPKAIAAERHLRKINSSVRVEGIVMDVNSGNMERLVAGAHVILDGLDNYETRYLINDVALKLKIPWIYGGAVGASGMTMTVIPGETPCFRCIMPSPPGAVRIQTCDTAGVLNSIPFIIGALQSAEAIKLLVGDREHLNKGIISIDVWENSFHQTALGAAGRADCPACQGRYEYLEAEEGTRTTVLCGHDAVQIYNPKSPGVSLAALALRLKAVGEVTFNNFMLRLQVEGREIVVFPDSRAIIKDTRDESLARGLYAKYIGM
ncbi:MAG: ThiF family adenylyltransferase [Chloroflexi bacterium]|nr:ThiF family adenylyltransferase [Chloroflexota bacterium]